MIDLSDGFNTGPEILIFAVVFVLVGATVGAAVAYGNPHLDERMYYTVQGEPEYTGDRLVFTRDAEGDVLDISSVNAVYRESEDEAGWCLQIDGEQVTIQHPVHLEEVTEQSIVFHCKDVANGIMHTHPSPLGVPELSEQDKVALVRSDLLVSCVLSSPVPDYAGENPVTLNCFENPYPDREFTAGEASRVVRDAEFRQMEVVIE